MKEQIPHLAFDEATTRQILDRWGTAPDWNRQKSEARTCIIQAVQNFIKEKGIKQSDGEETASILYNQGSLPGIEQWIYQEISSISPATIRRWRALSKNNGKAGLLTNYGSNKGKQRSIDPEIKIFVVACLKNTPGIRKSNVYKLIQKTFKKHVPCRKTVERFIDTWNKDNPQLSAIISDPKRWKNNMMAAFGSKAAGINYFCHTWEIDSTPADVITQDKQRCAVIGLIDVFSRRAKLFISTTSRSIAVAACIREALISWGIPGCIRMDNGKDYSSRHIEAITSALKIETPKLPPYTPEAKPFIERFFGTYSRGLEELLPGYCGHSVAERQKIREQTTWAAKIVKSSGPVEVPLTMQELKTISDRWLKIYESSPHKGLGGLSPIEAAEQSTMYPQKIRDERVLDILLAPISEPRKVGKKGISIHGALFIAPELVEHVGRMVEARLDLQNAGLIFVFDATKKKFLCKATNEELSGKTLEEYNIVKKRQLRDLKEKSQALSTLGLGYDSPLEILLGDELTNRPRKIVHLQTEADHEDIREARRAITGNLETVQVAPIEPGEVIPIKPNLVDPRDDSWMTADDLDKEYERALEITQTKRAFVRGSSRG